MGLADAGAKIICVDIQPENVHQCADDIKPRGGEALGVVCDVTDEAQVQGAVTQAREHPVALTSWSTARSRLPERRARHAAGRVDATDRRHSDRRFPLLRGESRSRRRIARIAVATGPSIDHERMRRYATRDKWPQK